MSISSFCQEFSNFCDKISGDGETVTILMHKDPDPDSLGSAFGIKFILKKKFNINSKIYYEGEITHRQNQTLINVMNIILNKMDEGEYNSYKYVILVDTTPTSGNAGASRANVVIDHHMEDAKNCDIYLVDPVGGCSTLIWEMINEYELELQDGVDEQLATLLFFGIRSDTNELLSDGTTDRDWKAYMSLSQVIDENKISQILNYSYPSYYREVEKLTFVEDNYIERQGWFICGLGYISANRKDSLPTLAEKITRIEGYETAIIFAIIEDKLVASVRSINNSVDVNTLMKKIFGKDCGGGRRGAGGATVPLGIFSPIKADDDTKSLVWKAIRNLCFQSFNRVALGK